MTVEDKLVNQLFETIIDKLLKNEEDSTFFMKYDYHQFSNKINKNDFLRALEDLEIKIQERDFPVLSRVLDPDNTGLFDLSHLMEELKKKDIKNQYNQRGAGGKFKSAYDRLEVLSETEEKAIRSILDEIFTYCKKSNYIYNIAVFKGFCI